MRRSRGRRQSGMTLMEVFIASIILAALFGMTAYLVWSSSQHVQTTESALQLEVTGREFLDGLTKELHQSKMSVILKLNTSAPIPTDAPSMNSAVTPGTPAAAIVQYDPVPPAAVGWGPHGAADFDGIRFKVPGYVMDLTKNNANADNNGSVAADKKNFDLKAFKASVASAEASAWLYEIQYWWEIDNSEGEGTPGAGPNGMVGDLVDNNKNGIVDEGVVCKMESWFNTDGTLQHRTKSVICRGVKSLKFWIPRRAWTGSDWSGTVTNPATQIAATLTLERPDPKYPKDPSKNIVKTVSTVIDLRN